MAVINMVAILFSTAPTNLINFFDDALDKSFALARRWREPNKKSFAASHFFASFAFCFVCAQPCQTLSTPTTGR